MDAWVWILIAVVAVVVVAAVVWWWATARRRRDLQERFGPEYERAVADAPTQREAEHELRERAERREQLDIRPLSPGARDRFASSWEAAQARFVDDPGGAIEDADDLVQRVMRERGYPVEDFDQRAADLSVDHPELVDNYRNAHRIRRAQGHDDVTTEDLRQGFVHYRALFDELLETREPTRT